MDSLFILGFDAPKEALRLSIILGIDPGLRRTGWGMVTIDGNRLSFLACGSVETDNKAALAVQLRATVWPLIEAGKVKPVIHQVFPAVQAAQAHALMESSVHVGKIVLNWSS